MPSARRVIPAQSQGNRVKDLCGDEADEEFVVPRGDFTSEADGIPGPGPSDEVEGHVF